MRLVRKIARLGVMLGVMLALTVSAFAAETGTTTDAGLRLRSKPSTDSKIYDLLAKGTKLDILETLSGWYRVSVNGINGYVSASYVRVDKAAQSEAPAEEVPAAELPAEKAPERRGIVTGGTINVRTGPSTDYKRITTVRTGKLVTITGEQDGWYAIRFDGVSGYICGDYVNDYSVADTTIGEQIVALARQYVGVPYVYGGTTSKGFDCSGLTMYLYKQFGYSLPHSATSQYKNCGQPVAKSDLQPGDLVFFSDGGSAIGHVAIYIGNGEILHARNSVGSVTINSLYMSYYVNHYVGAKRIA